MESSKQHRMYRCERKGCGAILSTAWNLKRHNLDMHQLPISAFLNTTAFNFEDSSPPPAATCDTTTSMIQASEALFENTLPFDLQFGPQGHYGLASHIHYQDPGLTQAPTFPKFYSSLLSDPDRQSNAALHHRPAATRLDLDFCWPKEFSLPYSNLSLAGTEEQPSSGLSSSFTPVSYVDRQSLSISIQRSSKDNDDLFSDLVALEANSSRGSNSNSSPIAQSSSTSIESKRKRSIHNDRIFRARVLPSMPEYEVRESKVKPGQQKAIDWLSRTAKQHFDSLFETLIVRLGGVKPTHRGACVLCPEDWRSLTPSSLASSSSFKILTANQLPARQSPRLTFQYSDHVTTFARAVAWYRSGPWPRTGVSLDNLLGGGPFTPMEASHLCHQEHCIVHVSYESAEVNQDRKNCALRAHLARHAGDDFPSLAPIMILRVFFKYVHITGGTGEFDY